MSLLGALFGDLGAGDVGVNMNDVVKAANAVRPMSVAAGVQLVNSATHALDVADQAAKLESLPGQASRDRVRAQLEHLDLMPYADPLPDDVAELVRQAFQRAMVEFNAAAEGSKTLAGAREQLYSDVLEGIKSIPKMVGQAVGATLAQAAQGVASGLFSTTTGIVLTVAGIGVGGYLLYNSTRRRS